MTFFESMATGFVTALAGYVIGFTTGWYRGRRAEREHQRRLQFEAIDLRRTMRDQARSWQ